MKETDLLNSFLGGFPESNHPYDRERFTNYAIECVKNDHNPDWEVFKKNGLSNERIEYYEIAFEWIKETLDCLSKASL